MDASRVAPAAKEDSQRIRTLLVEARAEGGEGEEGCERIILQKCG